VIAIIGCACYKRSSFFRQRLGKLSVVGGWINWRGRIVLPVGRQGSLSVFTGGKKYGTGWCARLFRIYLKFEK
jgi:hypothetical protein